MQHSNTTSKKGDYWFLDRKGAGTRLLLLALAIGITLLGASCGANDQLFQDQDQSAAGIDVTRGTSDLLGALTGTVTNVVGTLSTKWYFDCDVVAAPDGVCPIKYAVNNGVLTVASLKAFDKVNLYYSDHSKDGISCNTLNLSLRLRKGLDGVMVRLKSDGSKWYCDNGKWFIDVDSARWYGDVDSANAGSGTQGNDNTQANSNTQ